MSTGIPVIVQARMSSSRLPGKMLLPLKDETPLLGVLLDGLAHCGATDEVVVATSVDPTDDAIAAYCAERGVRCFRGPLDDVAGRFLTVLDELGCEAFVRTCGDSPLLDPALVEQGIALFEGSGADLATNALERTFPKGQSVEVVDVSAFRALCRSMTTLAQREHVTQAFYARPEKHHIVDFRAEKPCGTLQLSVDTKEDFALAARLLAELPAPHWKCGWQELARRMAELRGEEAC